MSKVIATRVNEELLREIELVSKVEGLDKSSAIKKLLLEGLKKWKLDYAIKLYKEEKVSIWKAARIANISIWELIEIIKEKNITLNLDESDLEGL